MNSNIDIGDIVAVKWGQYSVLGEVLDMPSTTIDRWVIFDDEVMEVYHIYPPCFISKSIGVSNIE